MDISRILTSSGVPDNPAQLRTDGDVRREPSEPKDGVSLSGKPEAEPAVPGRITKRMLKHAGISVGAAASQIFSGDIHALEKKHFSRHVRWSHPVEKPVNWDTAYDPANRILYAVVEQKENGKTHKRLRAFNADGSIRWTHTGSDAVGPAVVGRDGTVYARLEGHLRVLDKDGNENWKFATNEEFDRPFPPAVGDDGAVYMVLDYPSSNGHQEFTMELACIKDGEKKWRYQASDYYCCTPLVRLESDGNLYFIANKRYRQPDIPGLNMKVFNEKSFIIKIDPATGKELKAIEVGRWNQEDHETYSRGPDGTLYACHDKTKLTAFTPEGVEKWTFQILDAGGNVDQNLNIYLAPSFDDQGNLYMVTKDVDWHSTAGTLFKIGKDGKEQWRRPLKGGQGTVRPLVTPDGLIYAGTKDGNLIAHDRDGNQKGCCQVGKFSGTNISLGDNNDLILNTDRALLAFKPGNLKLTAEDVAQAAAEKQPEPQKIEKNRENISVGGVSLTKRKKKFGLLQDQMLEGFRIR